MYWNGLRRKETNMERYRIVKEIRYSGCMVDMTSSKGESIYTYTDIKGNKSAECPNCI